MPTSRAFWLITGRDATGCARGCAEVGFVVAPPAGTCFAVADIRPLGYEDDVAFCRMLPELCGVAAIPVSAFRARPGGVGHLVRFAFCKSDALLDEGLRRLRRLKETRPTRPA
jgi:N-succinyldiaminopimelate aminotransferase